MFGGINMKEIDRQSNIQNEIKKILKEVNYIYQGFYNFKLQVVNAYIDRYCIIDEFEEFDYGSQDFDNCLEFLENKLKKVFNDDNLYLEEEVKGRWNIVLQKGYKMKKEKFNQKEYVNEYKRKNLINYQPMKD